MSEPMVRVRFQIEGDDRVFEGKMKASFRQAPFKGLKGIILGPELSEQDIVDGKVRQEFETEDILTTEISEEARLQMIEEYFNRGFATRRIYLANRYPVDLKTLTAEEQTAISIISQATKIPKDHTRMLPDWEEKVRLTATLAFGIELYRDAPIGNTREEKEAWVLAQSTPLVTVLTEHWNRFNADVARMLRSDIIGDWIKKS